MIYKDFQDLKLSALGMGCMRLPSSVDEKGNKTIHREEAIKMIRYAVDHGVNYFDSALMYFDGDCDKLLGEGITTATQRLPWVRPWPNIPGKNFTLPTSSPVTTYPTCPRCRRFLRSS